MNVRLHYAVDDPHLNVASNAEAFVGNAELGCDCLGGLFGPPGNSPVHVFEFRVRYHWERVPGGSAPSGAIRPFNVLGPNPQLFLTNYGTLGHELVHMMTYDQSEPSPAGTDPQASYIAFNA